MKKINKYFLYLAIIITFAAPSKGLTRHISETEEQILNLRKQIYNHDYNYFVKNHSEISDSEYDSLLAQLQKLENNYPQFLAYDSPTQKIGNNLSQDFKKVQHTTKLYSLGKVYSEQELNDWYNKILANFLNKKVEFVCELKIDGLTAALTYKNGEFIQGSTRGNGVIGQDAAITLANKYHSVKDLASANEKELVSLNGIGKTTAKNTVIYFKNAENLTLLKNLQQSEVKGIDF